MAGSRPRVLAAAGAGVTDKPRTGTQVRCPAPKARTKPPGLPSAVHLAPSRPGVLLARACRRALAEDDYDPIAESRKAVETWRNPGGKPEQARGLPS
jgi:hypothetical protein